MGEVDVPCIDNDGGGFGAPASAACAYPYADCGDDYVRATADYDRSLRISPMDVYTSLWLYLAEMGAGMDPLQGLSVRSDARDVERWPNPLSSYFLRRISFEELLEQTSDKNPQVETQKKSEVSFFVGINFAMAGNIDRAKKMLTECLAMTDDHSTIHKKTKLQLERMGVKQGADPSSNRTNASE